MSVSNYMETVLGCFFLEGGILVRNAPLGTVN